MLDQILKPVSYFLTDPKQGLVVITGSVHSGIVNTTLYAQKMLGQNLPVYALLGGFHLFQMKIGDAATPGTLHRLRRLYISSQGIGIGF